MQNTTQTDLVLASVYFPLLVEAAKEKNCITYSGLVRSAKSKFPSNEIVQNAYALSTGRRLDVIRMFTKGADHPALTSIVINDGTGERGPGFYRCEDGEIVRDQVFAYDWESVEPEFKKFIASTEQNLPPRHSNTKEAAHSKVSAYYQAHRRSLGPSISQYHRNLVESVMEGIEVEEAFRECLVRMNLGTSNT